MYKIKSVFVLLLISIVLVISGCTSSNSDNNDNGDETQVIRSTWQYFIPELTSFSNIFEDDKFFIFIGNSIDEKDSYLVKVNKNGDNYITKKYENTHILNFVKDINGNFIALNQKSESPTYLASLMYLSQDGEKLNEVVFENAKLISKSAISTDDNGVIFSYVNNEEKSKIVKVDFSGNILWEKEFGKELDPALPESNVLIVNNVSTIKIDSDKNIVIFQKINKTGPEGEVDYLDSGYSYYKLNTNGSLIYAKAFYKTATVEYVSYSVTNVELLNDNNFLLEGRFSTGLDIPVSLSYYDSFGDLIKHIYKHGYTNPFPFVYMESDNTVFMVRSPIVEESGPLDLVKMDFEGTEIWKKSFDPQTYENVRNGKLTQCEDKGFLYVGGFAYEKDNQNQRGIYLLKIDKDFKTP